MYSKSVTYKFTSFTSAKIAGHCTEYLSRHVVKLEMSSLTITVNKESEVSISANFDDIGNLKNLTDWSVLLFQSYETHSISKRTISHPYAYLIIKKRQPSTLLN